MDPTAPSINIYSAPAAAVPEVTTTGGIMSKIPWKYIIFTVIIALVVGLISYFIIKYRKTIPLNEGFSATLTQEIVAPINTRLTGADAAFYGQFETAAVQTDEGRADLHELSVILEKLTAMKKDLEGVNKTVSATKGLPYTTTHDREPVSETVARCFSKTIPVRDLDITFETLRNRGQALVYRLATVANIDSAQAAKQFADIWAPVYQTAQAQCISGEPAIAGKAVSPREAIPYDMGLTASPVL